MPLRHLQRDLQQHLLGAQSAIAAGIVDAPPLPIADRLGIYRSAYQIRLIEALGETYPVLYSNGHWRRYSMPPMRTACRARPYAPSTRRPGGI